MAVYRCKSCGGELDVQEGLNVVECDYCGIKQSVPTIDDENVQRLYNRANVLRIRGEFDKAEEIYEKILQTNEKEAEAYWGIILCRYGIEYVEDSETHKRVPTCHRTSLQAIRSDADYKSALTFADAVQRKIYEEEAAVIDEIQKEILKISNNEEPYDVFICYKEADEKGEKTVDSTIANEIYYHLTEEGMKVFYAAITLEERLGKEYEPYIFAALNSAKVMLVLGTKPEYFHAVWVKNEWSRFLKLMKEDRSKTLIPCYRDMEAYELPDEFLHLQAQDMSKIGFIIDLIRGVKKIVDFEEKSEEKDDENFTPGADSLLERAYLFLEDKEWDLAREYCERVLDMEPRNAHAYLGKLMADCGVTCIEDLVSCKDPFDDNGNYEKAIRFADEELKNILKGYVQTIEERNKEEILSKLYKQAVFHMEHATRGEEYISVAKEFSEISEYKDAQVLSEQCAQKGNELKKDEIYYNACRNSESNYVELVYGAIKLFESIPGWKDSDQKIKECHEKIAVLEKKQEEERIKRESQKQQKEELQRKRNKNNTIGITMIILLAAVCCIYLLSSGVFGKNDKTISEKVENERNKIIYMPDVIGKHIDDVKGLLEDIEIKEEYNYTEDIEEGIIYDTSVKAGNEVPEYMIVKITVSKGIFNKVPNVINMNIEDAKTILEEEGLAYIIEERLDDADKGVVLDYTPEKYGDKKEDIVVELTVCKGRGIVVPNVVGKNVETAKSELSAAGLGVNITEQYDYMETDPYDISSAMVKSQDITGRIESASDINIVVTKPAIKITAMGFSIDSSNGVDTTFAVKNVSNKQIAYVTIGVKFYDRMGYYVGLKGMKYTGPLNTGKSTGEQICYDMINDGTVGAIMPYIARVEFTDGTRQDLSYNGRFWSGSGYYGGELH